MKIAYAIKKNMISNGKPVHVLLNDSHSQVLEFKDEKKADEYVEVLNANSDSNWTYEKITIGKSEKV